MEIEKYYVRERTVGGDVVSYEVYHISDEATPEYIYKVCDYSNPKEAAESKCKFLNSIL